MRFNKKELANCVDKFDISTIDEKNMPDKGFVEIEMIGSTRLLL